MNERIKNLDEELKKENVKIIEKDEIIKLSQIGEGKFGKVFNGKYGGNDVAIKKMIFESLGNENIDEIINEIKNLNAAECDFVPKFFGVWKGLKNKHYHLIFELIKGTNLRDSMQNLTLDEKLNILYKTVEIVSVLHKRKLIHRDLKPENIMIDLNSSLIKLIDFGTAKLATKTVTFTAKAVGTTFYMAPDFFDVDEDNDDDKPISNTAKLDIWSLGCILSEFLSGVFPWSNMTKNENRVEKCLINKIKFPIPKEIDENFPQFKPLIENCLKLKPVERCCSEDIMNFLLPHLKK